MKRVYRIPVFWLVFLLLFPAVVKGKGSNNGWGIGVILGEPTGISLKLWTGGTTAFDAAAAWSFRNQDKLHLHLDYLVHNYKLIKVESGKLPVYYGIGGRVKFEDDTRVGVRIPVGLCYQFANHPIDIFLEVVPVLDVAPETHFDVNASIGARYFFN